ncbi:hypothetical protein GCM10023075_60750 [Streptosporangium album]
MFGLIKLTPTDPVTQILGDGAGEEAKACAARKHDLAGDGLSGKDRLPVQGS